MRHNRFSIDWSLKKKPNARRNLRVQAPVFWVNRYFFTNLFFLSARIINLPHILKASKGAWGIWIRHDMMTSHDYVTSDESWRRRCEVSPVGASFHRFYDPFPKQRKNSGRTWSIAERILWWLHTFSRTFPSEKTSMNNFITVGFPPREFGRIPQNRARPHLSRNLFTTTMLPCRLYLKKQGWIW